MSHYFINDNDIKSNEKKNKVFINEQSFSFWTDNGVFSKKGLDFGTRTLLESIPMKKIHGNVLDFGCGYGPIGITLAKQTDANVDMLDINERALNLTLKNIKENKVNANTILSNLYDNINKKYDHIVSNPPIRVGKEILFKILFGAKEHLKENGKLWIVVNKNQGAKSLVKELENEYKVEIICKNKGFYIICATNN
jgi:16S rRNA (guanine1207-N2)-methyltransferase